jgi:dienelactone hydrolase
MDAVQKTHAAESFALMGICLGATLSFKTACEDPRVVGAILINPQDHLHDESDEELQREIRESANARHNWRIAFSSSMSGRKWRKALRGEVDFRSVAKILIGQARRFIQRSGGADEALLEIESKFVNLQDRGTDILHVFSEGDVGVDYLHTTLGRRMKRHRASGAIATEIIPGSNHTFTLLDNQNDLITTIGRWALALTANNRPACLSPHTEREQ